MALISDGPIVPNSCLQHGLPTNIDLLNKVAIVMCVEKVSSDISNILAASTPKSRSRDDLRFLIP